MKKNNNILLLGAGVVLYFLFMKKKKQTDTNSTPAQEAPANTATVNPTGVVTPKTSTEEVADVGNPENDMFTY